MSDLRNKLITLLMLTFLATTASVAQAALPHEISGSAQYTETLPGAGGDEPTSGPGGEPTTGLGGSTGGPPSKALGKRNAEALESHGSDGSAAAQLAASGVPDTSPRQPGQHIDEADTGNKSHSPRVDDNSGPGQVLGELTGTSDSEGMGALFPLLLGLAALAAVVFVVLRRRQTPADS